MSYFVQRNGRTLGPYSPSDVVTLLRGHQLGLEDLAVEEGAEDWQPLGNIVDPELLAPSSAPAAKDPAGNTVEREARTKRGGRAWKVIGFLAMTIGVVTGLGSSDDNAVAFGLTSAFLLFGGFIAFIIGRFTD